MNGWTDARTDGQMLGSSIYPPVGRGDKKQSNIDEADIMPLHVY